MKIIAGIVTFNPELDRLRENIEAVFPQVDQLILVDNGSENTAAMKELVSKISGDIHVIELGSNKGIAYALNVIGQTAIDQRFDWFLTLDQDTIILSELVETYKRYTHLPSVGTLSCEFQDLNKDETILPDEEYSEVNRVITSAALMNTEKFAHSGRFDNQMFIDLVDYDINIDYKLRGYKIYKINKIGFYHEIGESEPYRLFGRKVETSNHSAFRKYYLARNAIYLRKKYGTNSDTKNYLTVVRDDFFKILLFEKDKMAKFKAIFKGLYDGMTMKVEKWHEN